MHRKTSSRRAAGTAIQLAELSMAAPQVIAHRLTRIAMSKPTPSARDRQEFTGMIVEKQAAMSQAWMAVFLEMLRWQQAVALAWLTGASARQYQATATSAAMRMASGALAPFHRKAVGNARRLARTGLR